MGTYKRGKNWYIDYYFEGKRIRKRVGKSKRMAENILAARKTAILKGEHKFKERKICPRFNDFANEYIEYAKVNKRSWGRDVTSLKNLIPYFGEKKLMDITTWDIESYKTMRREKVSPATTNRELALLKSMFNLAIKWGKVESNPMKGVKLFKEKEKVMKILSPEEEERLLECSPEYLKPIIITALHTGMRLGEILRLTWDRVNLKIGLIIVKETKGGEIRTIPINSYLKDVLSRIKRKSDYVFCREDGTPYKKIRYAFDKAREKAELDCRFHDLRHSFASRLVMNGTDLVTVKELLGHKSINMTMRYAHPTPQHKREAVESLIWTQSSHKMVTNEEKDIDLYSQTDYNRDYAPVAQWIEQRTSNP